MNQVFTTDAIGRLRRFLEKKNQTTGIEILTPDASTREYFRINWKNRAAIACVYAEKFNAAEHSYLDVTALFLANDLPVAEIYQFDESFGIIILEDFGNTILREILHKSEASICDELLNQSISLIVKIQCATPSAFERGSIASRLKFDEEKLGWELNYFKTHYFETYRRTQLSQIEEASLIAEFVELSKELSERAGVLCHRDFHAANLMLDQKNRLRIIDHQDARIGTTSYDLVSLLLDRVIQIPDSKWLDEKKRFFLRKRENANLEFIAEEIFDYEFQLQTIQRCLKAVGTFSFQSVIRGKAYFIPYIDPMLEIVRTAAVKLDRFHNLQNIITHSLKK